MAYFVLHHFADVEIPHSTGIKNVGDAAVAEIWKTLAMIGQYVLPVAFLVGSLLSVVFRAKHKNKNTKY